MCAMLLFKSVSIWLMFRGGVVRGNNVSKRIARW